MTRFDLVRPARTRHAVRSNAGASTADLADVCGRYRRAVRRAGLVCPAEVLWTPAEATWVRDNGIGVETRSGAELSLALSVGVAPARIIMHCEGAQAGPIRCGLNARVGLFVVSSSWQADVLAHYVRRPQRVLVDVTAPRPDGAVAAVLAADGLALAGLHRRLDGADSYGGAVADMVAQMALLRRERGVLLTRLSVAGAVTACPWRIGADVDDALDDACARFRFPRPGVTLGLLWPVPQG